MSDIPPIGSKQGKEICALLSVEWMDGALGLDIRFIKPRRTRQQDKGFFKLLSTWAKMSNTTADKDDFYKWVMMTVFGSAEIEFPDGTIATRPLQTLTKRWDFQQGKYIKQSVTRDMANHLINEVYRIAAEGSPPVVLPELQRKKIIEELDNE